MFGIGRPSREKKRYRAKFGSKTRRRHCMKGRFHGKPDDHKLRRFGPPHREFVKFNGPVW